MKTIRQLTERFESKVEFLPAGEAGIPTALLSGSQGHICAGGSLLLAANEK